VWAKPRTWPIGLATIERRARSTAASLSVARRVFDSEADVAQLIVGLSPALASALARGVRTRDTTRLHHLTTSAHLDLQPQHARSLDALRTAPVGDASDAADDETVWFWAETGDGDQSTDLGTQLLGIPGVTAAYVKPPDGPP
jgi:hypothetical protein